MKIAVVGSGYVGLVTGTCLAEIGNTVICIDIDKEKVKSLNRGEITIYEPGLKLLFQENMNQGRLRFTDSLKEGVEDVEIIYLALPTPSKECGEADLTHILKVADQLGYLLKKYVVIVNKSTVPVGSARKVNDVILKNSNVKFDVVSNPEFLREGVAVEDFMKPDRIVIGSQSERAKKIMHKLYQPLAGEEKKILFMDEKSAELTKYAANSFLATKISFMNEIANISELLGTDVDMVREGIGTDPRIGKHFLFSGIGYGGSCFPKDVRALVKSAKNENYNFDILNAVMRVNEAQKIKLLPKIKAYFNGAIKGKTIAIWGLAFKPDTDDIREAPSLVNISYLLNEGVKIQVFDPEAANNTKEKIGNDVTYCDNQYDALKGADALLIITEWHTFKFPKFDKIKSLLRYNAIFDGRNLYKISDMKSQGIDYYSIGRKEIKSE